MVDFSPERILLVLLRALTAVSSLNRWVNNTSIVVAVADQCFLHNEILLKFPKPT